MSIMKKILFALAFVLCAASVSAQGWGLGARIGSGFQAQAEYTFSSNNYLEGRLGMGWNNPGANLNADLTLLYQWNIAQMDWTPDAGTWFFDAGVGVGVGGRDHFAYVGATGCAKIGIKFSGAPIKLAIDWTPVFGPAIVHANVEGVSANNAEFHTYGLTNFGLSCVYCF